MTTFVLVPGMCHGAWCFDDLAAALRAHGHRVLAVTLPLSGCSRWLVRDSKASWSRLASGWFPSPRTEGNFPVGGMKLQHVSVSALSPVTLHWCQE